MRIDVNYWFYESPLGKLLLATSNNKLILSTWSIDDFNMRVVKAALTSTLFRTVTKVDLHNIPTKSINDELDLYFSGQLKNFDTPISSNLGSSIITQKVLAVVSKIEYGKTISYNQITRELGIPSNRARSMGQAVGSNPAVIFIPCHRVIRADGTFGGYSGGVNRKAFLLKLEAEVLANAPISEST